MNPYDATEMAFKNGYKSGIMNFADRLKKYYNNLNGSTPTALTAYHIDQIKNELLNDKGEKENAES